MSVRRVGVLTSSLAEAARRGWVSRETSTTMLCERRIMSDHARGCIGWEEGWSQQRSSGRGRQRREDLRRAREAMKPFWRRATRSSSACLGKCFARQELTNSTARSPRSSVVRVFLCAFCSPLFRPQWSVAAEPAPISTSPWSVSVRTTRSTICSSRSAKSSQAWVVACSVSSPRQGRCLSPSSGIFLSNVATRPTTRI